MSKCSTTNFNVDAAPSLLPRPEKSTVRSDMNKAMKQTMLRKQSGSAVTDAEKAALSPMNKIVKRKSGAAVTKGEKRFDAAMQNPVMKNLGL